MNIRAPTGDQIDRPAGAAPDLGRQLPKTRKIGVINTVKPQYIVSDALMDTTYRG
jgi:methanogenic corrinoid protein MtbC1